MVPDSAAVERPGMELMWDVESWARRGWLTAKYFGPIRLSPQFQVVVTPTARFLFRCSWQKNGVQRDTDVHLLIEKITYRKLNFSVEKASCREWLPSSSCGCPAAWPAPVQLVQQPQHLGWSPYTCVPLRLLLSPEQPGNSSPHWDFSFRLLLPLSAFLMSLTTKGSSTFSPSWQTVDRSPLNHSLAWKFAFVLRIRAIHLFASIYYFFLLNPYVFHK